MGGPFVVSFPPRELDTSARPAIGRTDLAANGASDFTALKLRPTNPLEIKGSTPGGVGRTSQVK